MNPCGLAQHHVSTLAPEKTKSTEAASYVDTMWRCGYARRYPLLAKDHNCQVYGDLELNNTLLRSLGLHRIYQVFMMTGDLDRHLSKPRFRHLFDRVHMSLTAVDVAGSTAINDVLADQAVVTMDTGR